MSRIPQSLLDRFAAAARRSAPARGEAELEALERFRHKNKDPVGWLLRRLKFPDGIRAEEYHGPLSDGFCAAIRVIELGRHGYHKLGAFDPHSMCAERVFVPPTPDRAIQFNLSFHCMEDLVYETDKMTEHLVERIEERFGPIEVIPEETLFEEDGFGRHVTQRP